MADHSIYFNSGIPLKDALSELPVGFRSFLKAGFAIVAELTSRGKTAQVVNVALEEEGNPGGRLARGRSQEIATNLGIALGDIPKVLTSVIFSITLFIQQKGLTPDQFLAAAKDAGMIEEPEVLAVRPFIEFVAQNRAVSVEITDRNQVASGLLPSMVKFSTVIDIRPAFTDEGDEVKFSVPVVVARIENDATDDVWLQMSKRQVQQLISDLQTVLRKVEVAEKWYARERNG